MVTKTAISRDPSALALGIDIGGTSVKAALVNVRGEQLKQFRAPSPRNKEVLQEFISYAMLSSELPLRGIGIGCKGIIDAEHSHIDRLPGDLHFLEGISLPELVGAEVPVYADNDARTALIAEVLWGAASGKRNVILLTLGTGLGGAAMVDGVLLHGAKGIAGHFGHMTVNLDGALCMCGNRGCLETVFSSRAIEADYFAHIHRAAPVTLHLSEDGRPPSAESIFRAAVAGDGTAQRVVERATQYLSASVVSLIHVFDPEMVIIAGNMAAAGDQLLAPIRTSIQQHSRRMMGGEVLWWRSRSRRTRLLASTSPLRLKALPGLPDQAEPFTTEP